MDDVGAAVLGALAAGPVAVDDLADRLGVAEAVIDRAVDGLLKRGVRIDDRDETLRLSDELAFDVATVERVLPARYAVLVREEVGSTNDLARAMATAEGDRVAVVADRQREGRGRRGRRWASPSGGIWASLATVDDRDPRDAWVDQLAMAVATTDVLDRLGLETRLKWPNDLVAVDGAKLGGVLVEAGRLPDGSLRTIVGVGLDLNVPTSRLPPDATSVAERLGRVDRVALLAALVSAFETRRTDAEATLAAWRDRSATLGRLVVVRTDTAVHVGRAVGLDGEGSLRVGEGSAGISIRPERCRRLRYLASGD